MADMCGCPLLWPTRHSYLRDNDKIRGSALGSSEKEMTPWLMLVPSTARPARCPHPIHFGASQACCDAGSTSSAASTLATDVKIERARTLLARAAADAFGPPESG